MHTRVKLALSHRRSSQTSVRWLVVAVAVLLVPIHCAVAQSDPKTALVTGATPRCMGQETPDGKYFPLRVGGAVPPRMTCPPGGRVTVKLPFVESERSYEFSRANRVVSMPNLPTRVPEPTGHLGGRIARLDGEAIDQLPAGDSGVRQVGLSRPVREGIDISFDEQRLRAHGREMVDRNLHLQSMISARLQGPERASGVVREGLGSAAYRPETVPTQRSAIDATIDAARTMNFQLMQIQRDAADVVPAGRQRLEAVLLVAATSGQVPANAHDQVLREARNVDVLLDTTWIARVGLAEYSATLKRLGADAASTALATKYIREAQALTATLDTYAAAYTRSLARARMSIAIRSNSARSVN